MTFRTASGLLVPDAFDLSGTTQQQLATLIAQMNAQTMGVNPTAAAIGNAVPSPPSAAAIGAAVPSAATIAGLVGAAVPQPVAIAGAAYTAGQRIVDGPINYQHFDQYLRDIHSGAVGEPSNLGNVSAYHSYQIRAGIANGARGTDYAQLAIRFFADAGYSILLSEEVIELTTTASAGGTDFNAVQISDRCHGPYMQINVTTATSAGAAELVYDVILSNRQADRFRVSERLSNVPGAAANGTDGILLDVAQSVPTNSTSIYGVSALYSGEVTVYANGSPSVPFIVKANFGSITANYGLFLPSDTVTAGSLTFYRLKEFVVLPRRPIQWSVQNLSTSLPLTVALSIARTEY